MTADTTIAFRTNSAQRTRLENAARAQNRTLSNYLRSVLRKHEAQERTLEQGQKNEVH